jgi:SAM-dependent methyltransferase
VPQQISLADLVRREPVPEPWAEGDKIPWDEPSFSERMLAEHLSQEHDLASRRRETIERHVDWIIATAGLSEGARVLDLGCGPGLYTSSLARRGFACRGIDFSPASIAYARAEAASEELDCRYELADLRAAEFGGGFALVMMIFGEFNAFRREEARSILERARAALEPGGHIIVEAHSYAAVESIGGGRRTGGGGTSSWQSAASGLFSDRPHVRLYEAFWDADRHASTERYYVIDAGSAEVTAYAQSMQAYDDASYGELFTQAGLRILERHGTLEGAEYVPDDDFVVIVAEAVAASGTLEGGHDGG